MFPAITNFITASEPLSRVLYFFTTVFPILVLIVSLLYVWKRRRMEQGIFAPVEKIVDRATELFRLGIMLIAVWIASALFKIAFQTPRPFLTTLDLQPLFELSDYSFPSQHAAIFAALAVFIFKINRRIGVFVGVTAIIIGIARILAGVHTPVDILGGYLLGALCVVFADWKFGKKSEIVTYKKTDTF